MKTTQTLWTTLWIALSLLITSLPQAQADEIYTFVVKKQEEKAKTRWSLEEWLATRDKMRLMDLWLALHSPSPYEFYLSGGYQMLSSPQSGETGYDFAAVAYASIFGLGVQKVITPSDSRAAAAFYLRIFGYQAQGMNITLQTGIRQSDLGIGSFRNAFAGLSMTIYLMKFFGVEGLYRSNFKSVPGDTMGDISGSRYEGTGFIDFKYLRVFGTYFSEGEDFTSAGATQNSVRSGTELGLKLFF